MIKYCECCNKPIDLDNIYGSGRFCNISCKNKFISKKQKPKERKRKEVICKNCGKTFLTTIGSKKIFCSFECSSHFSGNKSRKHSKETKERISKSMNIFWSNHIIEKPIVEKPKRYCETCGKEICFTNKTNFCKEHYKVSFSPETLLKLRESGQKVAAKRQNRSYNEIRFCNLLKEHYDNIINNERFFNGWDADIILPDLKVAILWNGPWHYKDIFGQLKQIQNRDKIKYSEIVKAGYMPYIIVDFTSKNEEKCQKEFKRFLEFANMLKLASYSHKVDSEGAVPSIRTNIE